MARRCSTLFLALPILVSAAFVLLLLTHVVLGSISDVALPKSTRWLAPGHRRSGGPRAQRLSRALAPRAARAARAARAEVAVAAEPLLVGGGAVAPGDAAPLRQDSVSEPEALQQEDMCRAREHTEYDGPVVKWGANNIQPSASACCESAREARAESANSSVPLLWVYCGASGGCGTQKRGECWIKRAPGGFSVPPVRAKGEAVLWTSGGAYTPDEARAVERELTAAARRTVERREWPSNPRVYFDTEIDGARAGRIEFILYAREAPRAAENFRAMCVGEKGGKLTFDGMRFYRILDQFIDQAGAGGGSIWGGAFDDDPAGLALRHERPGLLSAANAGPDTNSGHFSIVVAPAPHLDGSYTIFGEVVRLASAPRRARRNTPRCISRVVPPAGERHGDCDGHQPTVRP